MNFSSSDDEDNPFEVALEHWRKMQRYGTIACILGVYYYDSFMNKAKVRDPELSRYDWVR